MKFYTLRKRSREGIRLFDLKHWESTRRHGDDSMTVTYYLNGRAFKDASITELTVDYDSEADMIADYQDMLEWYGK
jgi:hypothetical protein